MRIAILFVMIALLLLAACESRDADTKPADETLDMDSDMTSDTQDGGVDDQQNDGTGGTVDFNEPPNPPFDVPEDVDEVTVPNTDEVSLGVEFRAVKGKDYQVKGKDAIFRISNFLNADCTGITLCVGGGKDVKYEVVANGRLYRTSYKTPYKVNIVDSDYETYAKIILTKTIPDEICGSLRFTRDECLKDYARDFHDPVYCNAINDEDKKMECLALI
ncbi:hypothetical protein JW868_03855 [Candidatus Woesearchaeota archaeon]|nr:hypothetical protein [Candidatus Woesearchaeota archaeon]